MDIYIHVCIYYFFAYTYICKSVGIYLYTRYIYLCVCVCVYIYLYICKYKRLKIIARDNFLIPPLTRPLSLHICKRTLIYIHLNLY